MSVCLSGSAVIKTSPLATLSPFGVVAFAPPDGTTVSSFSSDRFVRSEPLDVDGRADGGH